uniref:protein FAM3B-like isoform X2 n=1 Tax=Myxine glutinosa TaxID=7769 RepID=UPI00358ECECB
MPTLREVKKRQTNMNMNMEEIKTKSKNKAPVPRRNPCDLMQTCPPEYYPFRIMSGVAKEMLPKLCFNDQRIFETNLEKLGRGMNIVVLEVKTGALVEIKAFDMYEGAFSQPMVTYLKSISTGSFILIATFDDGATRLSQEAKTLLTEMGSKEISELRFRDSWVLAIGKGHDIGGHYEQIIHYGKTQHTVGNWPMQAVVDGCLRK